MGSGSAFGFLWIHLELCGINLFPNDMMRKVNDAVSPRWESGVTWGFSGRLFFSLFCGKMKGHHFKSDNKESDFELCFRPALFPSVALGRNHSTNL